MGGTASGIRAGRAFVEVGTDNNPLSRGLANAQARIAMFGKSVQAVGASLARTGLFAGLPFAASAKQFSSFESAMARIKAIKNPTEEVFKSLGDKAKQLGRDTAYSAAEAAAGMVHFAEAGLTAEQMLHAIGPALDLAAAGNISVAEATETVAKVMKEFKLPASDVVRIVDGLAKASTISLAPVLEMAEGLKKAGPIARELGINLEDTIAILSLLTDSALQGEEAGTALRGMMKSLIAPTDDAQKAMDELGLKVDDGKGNFLGFAAVMGQLEKKLSKLGPTDRMKKLSRIFETRQLTAAASLVGVGGPGIGKQQKEIAGGAGTGARIAKVQLDTLAGSAKILFSSIQGVGIEIGAALSPSLRRLADILIGAANGMSVFITSHKSLVVNIAKVIGGVVATGAAMYATGLAVQALALSFGVLHRAVQLSVVGFRAANFALLILTASLNAAKGAAAISASFSAIGAAFGAIVAGGATLTLFGASLIAIGVSAYSLSGILPGLFRDVASSAASAFSTVKAFAVSAFQGITAWLATLPAMATTAFQSIVSSGASLIGWIGSTASSAIIAFGRLFPWTAKVASVAFTLIRFMAENAMAAISGTGSIALQTMIGAFKVLGFVASTAFGMVVMGFSALKSAVAGTFGLIGGFASLAFAKLSPIVEVIHQGMTGAFKILASVANAAFQGLIGGAKIIGFLLNLIPDIGTVANVAFGALSAGASSAAMVLRTGFTGAYSVIASVFSGIASLAAAVPGWFSIAMSAAGGFVSSILGSLTAVGSSVLSVFASIPSMISGVFANISSGVASAFGAIGAVFTQLRADAMVAFGGIADALKSGDIALAGQILMAALNVEFIKGINALKAIWADWGVAAVEVFRGVSFNMAALMIDAWAGIQIGFIDAIGFIQDAWSGLTTFLMKNWNHFGGFFAKVWATIKAKFTGGDLAAEIDRINKETADRDKELGGGGGPDAEREKRKKEIEEARKRAQDELIKMQEEEVERRRKEAAAGGAGADEALKRAQDELDRLLKQKNKVPEPDLLDEGYEAEYGPNKRKAAEDAIGSGLDKATRTATTKGTFSAAALQGFAAGDTVTDAVKSGVKEQRKTNEQLYRMRRQLEKGGQLV